MFKTLYVLFALGSQHNTKQYNAKYFNGYLQLLSICVIYMFHYFFYLKRFENLFVFHIAYL